MSRGTSTKGNAKRQEILEVALELISQQGYDRTSVREVARAVGLTQPGLIHYFSSKEQLYVEVLREASRRNIVEYAGGDAVATLTAILRHNADVPGLVRLAAILSAEGTDPSHPAREHFSQRYEWLRSEIAGTVRDAQVAGDVSDRFEAEAIASVLIGASDGLQLQWLLDPSTDMAGEVEMLWSLLRTTGSRHQR